MLVFLILAVSINFVMTNSMNLKSISQHLLLIIDPLNKKYVLFEATPDLPYQLNYLDKKIFKKFLLPESVFITHAHIGHYTGLMYFGREALGSKKSYD